MNKRETFEERKRVREREWEKERETVTNNGKREKYITSRSQIAIDAKTIIIGHVLNNKYDQLLFSLQYNFYLRVNWTVLIKLFAW